MKSSCCVLIALFLCAVSIGRAQVYEGSVCSVNDGSQGVCRKIGDCPRVTEQIKRGVSPKICSFDKRNPIVCCPRANPTPTPTPTRPITTTTTISRVDKSTAAGRKCQEYARYVYWEVEEQSIFLFPEKYNKSTCAMQIEELIVGGVAAEDKEFPHMAALGYGATRDVVQWKCGGSLISERFVLTAAHCLSARGIGSVSFVRLGDLNLYGSDDDAQSLTIAVAERIKHGGYNAPAHYNDIALLKLESDVTFSPAIRPACLNTIPGNPQGKLKVTASGWGKLEWTEEAASDSLMKVDLEIQDESRCNYTFRSLIKPFSKLKNGITPESMICAGDPKGKKDTCQGDSGGPLQIRLSRPDPFCMYSIVGLTSFGVFACGQTGQPAVYTRVSNYIPWIERHVWP